MAYGAQGHCGGGLLGCGLFSVYGAFRRGPVIHCCRMAYSAFSQSYVMVYSEFIHCYVMYDLWYAGAFRRGPVVSCFLHDLWHFIW